MKRKKIIIVSLLAIIILVIIYGINILKNHIFTIENQFVSNDYEISQETYDRNIEFELNLDDMSSEVGKKIEIDDGCYLVIDSLELQSNGQYDIVLMAHGKYSGKESILYTGNYYKVNKDRSYEIKTISKLYTNDNQWYGSSQMEIEKNSDSFGFSIESSLIKNKKCKLKLKGLNKLIIKGKGEN